MRYRLGYKIVLLLLLPKIIVVLAGCVCNENILYYKYRFSTLELKHLEGTQLRAGSGVMTINKNAYGIQIKLLAATSLAQANPLSAFMSTAYAFKRGCKLADYQPMDSIRSISIVDLAEEGSAGPAGDDITGRFRVYNGSYRGIEDYVKTFRYPDYNATGMETVEVEAQLLLMEPPQTPGLHRFAVTVYMKDGSKLEETTEPVYLQ
ncbi:DUF5034 domain-containing protein [Niabella hirudinis]|uniref:DUF5034 domain-containing protein n=1 Tax=Niabella hirudinis TaxID=1285929 RepID=UPI003EC01243